MTATITSHHRLRAAALVVSVTLAVVAVGGPLAARPERAAAPGQEGAELKAEYDEVLGREAAVLRELNEAQVARQAAGDKLRDLVVQTRTKQVELFEAQLSLQQAEVILGRRVTARERAERRVETARDRLRSQIVASYVTGGDTGSVLEAFLGAQNGEQIGQALAYGRAVSGSTESLVKELEVAEDARADAAAAARSARTLAQQSRDDLDGAARFLLDASALQKDLVDDLNAQVLIETEALRNVQGRKALVEGRINSMTQASDGVAMILASRQAGQPDWEPGLIEITTPLPGVLVSSKFGQRAHPILGITRLHAGADLGAPTGTPLYAPADGVVVLAEVRGGYGNTVVIDHGSSLGTLYGHNSQMLVSPGQEVKRGDVIALVGSTGLSTGPHLHFETRIKGMPIDPEGVIDFRLEVDYEALQAEGD